jgi:hypothetical protein
MENNMSSAFSLEDRLDRLEAESQIRQLIARYCFYIDDREIDRLATLFTPNACLRSADGVMNATGADAIISQFHRRFDALGPGQHFMHDIQIDFDGDGKTEATGRIAGHAELWRNNKMMITAIRYTDRYRNSAKGWRIAEREISFLYYVPLCEYPGILGTLDRNHAYDEPAPADFPERLPSWIDYEKSQGRG